MSLADVEQQVAEILKTVKAIEKRLASSSTGSSGDVASDRDLDGPHGDGVVRKDPKRWDVEQNGSYVGCKWSECPPEYLEAMASFRDWQAQQDDRKGDDDSKRKAKFARLDASRMRGWAQRKRNGWQAPAREEPAFGGGDDSVPF